MNKLLFAIVMTSILVGCSTNTKEKSIITPILKKVDHAHMNIEKSTIQYREIVQLDHHRMAKNDTAYTPPAIVSLFKDDSNIISKLIQKNQLIGLDMPFKVLAYADSARADKPSYAYTSAEFIQKRHGLVAADVASYKEVIDAVVAQLPQELISKTDVEDVEEGFGIITIKSDFSFKETIMRIRGMVRRQDNTLWFAQMDLQKDAKRYALDSIRPTMLFLYGVPKTGAEAMKTAPKIGLDAFCQKVLIYEDKSDSVYVAFNDATKFGELYYGESNEGQEKVLKSMELFLKANVTKHL